MTANKEKELRRTAVTVREKILKSLYCANSGHPGGSLSIADYMTYLYCEEMRLNPANDKDPSRDRFVLSKGHAAPTLYAILSEKGYIPEEDLATLRHIDSYLQGHPNMNTTPGVDMSTGSLGQGVSTAVGMAKAAKMLNQDIRVYTLLGDGELAEGQVWEAVMFASHYQLDNLCVAVDVNRLQIDGWTKDVMNLEPMDQKFEAFGCRVIAIDGHDFTQLEKGFFAFHENQGSGCPTVMLLNTIKGKGISFMENIAGWHGKAVNAEQLADCLKELNEIRAAIEEE